jgi:hypothetical protein
MRSYLNWPASYTFIYFVLCLMEALVFFHAIYVRLWKNHIQIIWNEFKCGIPISFYSEWNRGRQNVIDNFTVLLLIRTLSRKIINEQVAMILLYKSCQNMNVESASKKLLLKDSYSVSDLCIDTHLQDKTRFTYLLHA